MRAGMPRKRLIQASAVKPNGNAATVFAHTVTSMRSPPAGGTERSGGMPGVDTDERIAIRRARSKVRRGCWRPVRNRPVSSVTTQRRSWRKPRGSTAAASSASGAQDFSGKMCSAESTGFIGLVCTPEHAKSAC